MRKDTAKPERAQSAANVTVAPGVSSALSAETVCVCYQPGQETIDVEQVLAAEMRQKVVEFDMTLPKGEPDIDHVLDVYVKDVVIRSVDVICDKVVARGDMKVKVLYVAAKPNAPVHAFEKQYVKFMRDIDVEGALPDMKATADCTIEYVDYDFSECEPRRVHITIVLKFWTRVTTTTEMDVMALSPVDQIGAYENMTASASTGAAGTAYQFTQTQVSAAQIGGAAHLPETAAAPPTEAPPEVTVTEPEAMAGEKLSIEGTAGKVIGSRVNIRTGPGTNYPSITKVGRGDTVTIKEQAFGWYKVVLADGSTTGWIASWFVELDV